MSKHRLIFYAVALAVLFAAYVGYRLYENRVKTKESIPIAEAIQFEDSEKLKSTNRTFLQPEETTRQLPRDVKSRPPSLNLPLWTYTSDKWDSSATDPIKVIVLPMDAVKFHVVKLPDGETPPPKEKTLLERDIISQEVIYIKISPTPPIPPPPLTPIDPSISDEPPIPYPLIANVVIEQNDTSLTQLKDWIKSVGGAAQAQALLKQAGLSDSVRIETAIIIRQ